jgi:hypothetical protein
LLDGNKKIVLEWSKGRQMAKRDHQTKAAQARVLTEAEIEALSVPKLRKLLREGRAVLPPEYDLETMIAEELNRPKELGQHAMHPRPTVH